MLHQIAEATESIEYPGFTLFTEREISPEHIANVARTVEAACTATVDGCTLLLSRDSHEAVVRISVSSDVSEMELLADLSIAAVTAVRFAILIEVASQQITELAETIVFQICAALAVTAVGVLVDDVGLTYDPLELPATALGTHGRNSSAFFRAMTTPDLEPSRLPELPDPAVPSAPLAANLSDLLPDVRMPGGLGYLITSPHLPFLEAARCIAAASGDARVNPDGLPVFCIAPAIDPIEMLTLYPASQEATPEFLASIEPRGTPNTRPASVRREILIFSQLPHPVEAIAGFFALWTDERQSSAEALDDDVPDIRSTPLEVLVALDPQLPTQLGTIECGPVHVSVNHLVIDDAHVSLRALAELWRRPPALLGAPARSLTILEISSRELMPAKEHIADLLVAQLVSYLAASLRGVVMHRAGGVLDDAAITRQLALHRGLQTSWAAIVGECRPFPLS